MKKLSRLFAVLVVVLMSLTVVLAACEEPDVLPNENFKSEADYITLDSYKAYLVGDLTSLNGVIGKINTTVDASVTSAFESGKTAINAATDVGTAKAAYTTAAANMVNAIPVADGIQNFSGLSTKERTKILGALEAYSIRNGMLGLSMFENGGYVMYHDRITLGTENYIVGYGFGALAEGSITADLATESNAAWKKYYHTYDSTDPGTINYLNAQDSQVSDFYGYMGASYYTNFMNETKDGYDWVPELAVSDPEPVGKLDENGQATKWRFEIRSGLKYNTNSTSADRAAFNNREVVAEDFLTPFKLLLNQSNELYRGSELANQTGAAAIKGASAYYSATKGKGKGVLSDDVVDFSQVGIKVTEDEGKWYFEYELGAPVTMFNARYYISSSLYMPVPKDFIDVVGVENYLNFSSDKKTTPVDNSLSLGAYTLEKWDSEQQVVYKKNPNYVYASTKYAIEGIHINILTGATSDKELAFKEFLAGKLDSCGIPDTYLSQYSSDTRTRTTTGDSVFKLNVNALDQEGWIKLFGENGTYSQTTKDNYWTVEPALSNAHFRSALSYALNREDLATAKGRVPSVNYFSSNYMSDAENSISYNATEEHKNAVSSLLEGTQNGYSLELAKDYFRMALDELEADGLITPGTKKHPTVIEIEIGWFTSSYEEAYHKYIKQYWETAFNDESVTGGFYKLECNFWCGDDANACYDKILAGQYDIAFGAITGNPLDPLSFFSVNSTDPSISNNFTLNWAIDTNTLTEALIYNGTRWTFDALYNASQEASIIDHGKLVKSSELTNCESKNNEDGSITATIEITYHELTTVEFVGAVVFGGDSNATYKEFKLDKSACTVKNEKGKLTITVTVPKDIVDKVPEADNQGIDISYNITVGTATSLTIKSAYIAF